MPRPQRIRKPRFKTDDIKETDNDHPMDDSVEEYKPRAKRPRKAKVDTGVPNDEHEDVSAPPKKKARKAGSLSKLLEMPLDISFEIFASSHPLDLLRASRANKAFHTLLMARAARPIWIASWQTLPDAPTCPQDMIEPAFTRLAFEQICQNCGASGVRNVIWSLRMRVCAKCLANRKCGLVNMGDFYNKTDSTALSASQLIPWGDGFGKYRYVSFCLQSDVDTTVARLKSLDEGSLEYATFTQERREQTVQRKQWADQCKAWMSEQLSERTSDLDAARQRRKEAIIEQLKQMGFEKEFQWMEQHRWPVAHVLRAFGNLKSVKQPRELTDRVWMNIEQDLVTFMNETRQKRLADTWLCVLKKRVAILGTLLKERTPATAIVPRVMDVCTMDSIREVLERPLDVNDADDVTDDSFTDALANMDAVLAYADATRHDQMLSALPTSEIGPSKPTNAHLHLPAYVFSCQMERCRQAFTYEQAKAHRCISGHSAFIGARPYEGDWAVTDPAKRLEMVCGWVPESGGVGSIVVNEVYSQRAMSVIKMAGLDPTTATFADMDQKDPWFACKCWNCRREIAWNEKRLLDWRSAVDHNYNGPESMLELLEGNDRVKALDKQEEHQTKLPITGSPESRRDIWACTHCTLDMVDMQTIRSHLLETHTVAEPRHATDFKYSANCYAPRREVHFAMQEPPMRVPLHEDTYSDGQQDDDMYSDGYDNEFYDEYEEGAIGASVFAMVAASMFVLRNRFR